MKCMLLLAILPVLALGQQNCLPDSFSGGILDLITLDRFNGSVDFTKGFAFAKGVKEEFLVNFGANGLKPVLYHTDDQGNCHKEAPHSNMVWKQCADHTVTKLADLYQGFNKEAKLTAFEGKDPDGNNVQVIVADAGNGNFFPVIRRDDHGDHVDLAMFVNPKLGVPHPNVFNVPDPCPERTGPPHDL